MAKISDEVKSFFTGDATGLVTAVAKANGALDSNMKKERQAALEAKRSFDARASSIKNALVNPTGAATDGLNKLVSGMKLSAVTTGALGAGIALAADKFSEYRAEAIQARKETEAFNETYRRFSQANKRPSGAEDSSSLLGRLTEARDQETTLKDRRLALSPEPGSLQAFQLLTRYQAEDPRHAVENFKRDRDTNKSQLQDNSQTQVKLQKAVAESLRNTVDLTKEGLQGSTEQLHIKELELARTREIRALEGTVGNNPANKSAINERIDIQIAKERELADLRDKQFMRDSQALGISRRLVSDEERRVQLLQLESDGVNEQIRTRQFSNEEENQALLLRSGQLANDLREAKAAAAVAESQFHLAQQTTAIQRTNTSMVAQRYKGEQATLTTLREQLAAVEKINTTRARGLQITIDENENVVRLMRQEAGYGKSPSQIQQRINRDRKDEASRTAFDKRTSRDDGLLNVHKGMDGRIIDGIDMITGERRAPRPGTGMGEQGLHTGSLSDKPIGTTGAASLTRDADPDGGLSSGSTPRMFTRTSAAERLDKPTGAADVLGRHAGDPAHDPMARMNAAPIFPDLAAKMRGEFAGGYRIHPDSQAKLDRVGDALTNSRGRAKLGEQRQYSNELVRQMKDQSAKGIKPGSLDSGISGIGGTIAANRDIKSSHSVAQASMKIQADQLTALAASNELLGKVVTGITYLTQNWGFSVVLVASILLQ